MIASQIIYFSQLEKPSKSKIGQTWDIGQTSQTSLPPPHSAVTEPVALPLGKDA